ncbi:ABC transporter permease [Derxia gummosa]|uniref:ABC transporter permease n=1 Tax=Derxia gummosa DSM 723 TaxID=1121388 RepID=A0A8B6X7T7_9BURK|nr:ABC transporter permease [Derxia gummosa]
MKIVILWTDAVMFALVIAVLGYVALVRATPHLAQTWRRAFRNATGAVTATVLLLFVAVGLLDSLHYRPLLPQSTAAAPVFTPVTYSALDALLQTLADSRERSYSAPLAWQGFQKEAVPGEGGEVLRDFPRLDHGGAHLADPDAQWAGDVTRRALGGLALGGLAAVLAAALATALVARGQEHARNPFATAWADILARRTDFPVRAVIATLAVVAFIAGPVIALAGHYHVLGTDRTGQDLLMLALKSIRTALVIGTMTTLVTLPIAVGLGILAGYLRGWVDEVVQYVYTVINSIPYVLLIAAAVLILLIFIDRNAALFATQAERTDARLFFLCVILGMTSWTELCRLVRGEVLKLRELEYVQAAQAFGTSTWRIMTAHLLPNVMHLILINIVISFSGLVLAEAVLTYVGVGVDPTMASFGSLINTSRSELARDPVIWWTLATAFGFMFTLVLSANLFSDAVRDAFDPRSVRR